MKKMILIAVVYFSFIAVQNTFAQMVYIGEQFNIASDVLDEERNILVYTPAGYVDTTQNFPVMYLLDGGTHFHHASGIVQFLSAQGLIPEMIVVAVMNVDRTRDFSPTHVDHRPTTGGGANFLNFLESELIPYVNSNFRTQPFRLLVGHSLGGTFATHVLLNNPKLFNAYIAISPHLMYDDGFVVKEAETKLKSAYKHVEFYMTVGNEPDYFETLARFQSIVENKSPKGFELTYEKLENENHGSVPHRSIYRGLETIFSDWKIAPESFAGGLASIDDHYKKLSDKMGYQVETPELILNALGYYHLNEKEMEKAIRVFKANVKRYPNSANVYDSLGEAFENNGQLKDAEKNYRKALEMADRMYLQNRGIYAENLKRVQDKLNR